MKNYLTICLVLILALGTSIFIYFYLVLPQAPFSWDESHHSVFSLLIARSILQGNWPTFWHYTGIQIYWPFLHSWISSIFLLLGGFSYTSARLTNVVIGFFSIILIYLAGFRLGDRLNRATGLISALLISLSPMFLFFSATANIESLGLFLVLLLIWLRLIELRRQTITILLVSGIVLALLYLTKYIYAIFFGVGLVAFWISLLLLPGPGITIRWVLKSFLWTLTGFLLVWGLWFFIPPSAIPLKFGVIIYRIGDTGGFNPLGFTRTENLLFFVRALLYAYTFSIGIYLFYLGGIVFGLIHFRKPAIRLLILVFFSNFIPMSFISNSQERFIYVVIPALFLLTAMFIVDFWNRGKYGKLAISLLGGLLILGDIHKLPHYFREVGNAAIAAYAYPITNRFNYSSLFGLWSYPELLRFSRDHFNPSASEIMPKRNTGVVLNYILANTDPRSPVCVPFYIGSLSPHLWHWHSIIKQRPIFTNWRPDSHYYIALEVDDNSPYFILWNSYLITGRTRKWDDFLTDLHNRGAIRLINSKHFDDIGLRAKIYVRNISLDHPLWRTTHFQD